MKSISYLSEHPSFKYLVKNRVLKEYPNLVIKNKSGQYLSRSLIKFGPKQYCSLWSGAITSTSIPVNAEIFLIAVERTRSHIPEWEKITPDNLCKVYVLCKNEDEIELPRELFNE